MILKIKLRVNRIIIDNLLNKKYFIDMSYKNRLDKISDYEKSFYNFND